MKKLSNFFPDFYQNYDYDQFYIDEMQSTKQNQTSEPYYGVYSNNDYFNSTYLNDQSNNNITSSISILSQLSTPLFYIVLLLIFYCCIVFVLFMSALYSHRKRVGYNYDECADELSIDSELLMPELNKTRKNDMKVEITNEKANKLTHRSNESKQYSSVNDTDCESDNVINNGESDDDNNFRMNDNKRRRDDNNASKKVKQADNMSKISYLNKLFSLLPQTNNKSYRKLSNHLNKINAKSNKIKSKKLNKNSKRETKNSADINDLMNKLLI